MKHLTGVGTSDGIAIGRARVMAPEVVVIDRFITTDEVPAELERLQAALRTVDERLGGLSTHLDLDGLGLMEAHRLLLSSQTLIGNAAALIEGGLAAECAVKRAVSTVVKAFDRMADPYLSARGNDVEAIGSHLVAALLGLPEVERALDNAAGSIGVCSILSPVDAFHLKRQSLAGVITERGGKTSHAAIVLRALQVPAVFGVVGAQAAATAGELLIIDGQLGDVFIRPDEAMLVRQRGRQTAQRARTKALSDASTEVTHTLDGTRVTIGANVEALADLSLAIKLRAESIGLFRTELLYLERPDLPSEDEQYDDAVAALRAVEGRPVTFRTLDLGADKLALGADLPRDPNPSLGVRALRFSMQRLDIFRTQLRALYRASVEGPLRIMFPLVSGESEMRRALEVCAETRQRLSEAGIDHRHDVPIGAMLETPSAVLTTDHLSDCCDFFSVGTNDLIQYAFAADRDNPDVHHLHHPLHPAVLRLLRHAVEAATAAQKPLSVCGDMAAEPAYTWVLLGLGVRELSMAYTSIPAVRSIVAQTRLIEAQAMVAELFTLRSQQEIEENVMGQMKRRFPFELAEL